ncbi:hypothetical protein A0H81_06867 [Grifola frondosa]|uniref:Uncharacterized protein n=1 Tax=Grifola frondosa TaxID=5627 RepID=A0A1C7M7U5_GRIFR|nr:hypothetical protein A0H81_06867 [Grifola frondosa]
MSFVHASRTSAYAMDVFTRLSPTRTASFLFDALYTFVQDIIIGAFKPWPPPPSLDRPILEPRVAVVGAGLTGVSSAAHAVAHGFGTIWAHVNETSGSQLNFLLHRFHPTVLYSCAFLLRGKILGEVRRVWKEY